MLATAMRRRQPSWKRRFRYFYLRFVRLRGTPEQIARGFAFGVFWGMFPLPGVQMLIAIFTAALFHSNKLAAAAGTWLSNPLTTLPLTAINFHVGQSLLGREWSDLPLHQATSVSDYLQLGGDVIGAYLLGCSAVGTIAALVSYSLGIPLVNYFRQRNLARRVRRYHLRDYRSNR